MINPQFEPLLKNEEAIKIIDILSSNGFETRFIGGCVRDALLGRNIGDIDLATTALPNETIAALTKEKIKTIPTGIDHGTITAVINKKTFEITTLRKDVETDGRHATVSFTDDWVQDAQRRDFTINALSLGKEGCFFDYCEGLQDIADKQLRFIGNASQRIQEDYLRILRYFRFASVLNWDLEDKETFVICQQLASHLKSLSRERIQSELYKLLTGKNCLKIVSNMIEYQILQQFITEPGFERFEKTVNLENKHEDINSFRRLSALVDYTSLEHFIVLSRDHKTRIANLKKVIENASWQLEKLLYYFGQQAVKDAYFLNKPNWNFTVIENWQKPILPLKAADLPDKFGKELGDGLRQAELYWVDHNFQPTKQELIGLINRRV